MISYIIISQDREGSNSVFSSRPRLARRFLTAFQVLLLTHDKDHECVGQYGGPRMGSVRCGWRRRPELSGRQENLVRPRIKGHCTGSGLRLDVFNYDEMAGRILLDDGESAVTVGAEGEALRSGKSSG